MKKLNCLFLLVCLFGCSDNATNTPVVTDDFVIRFAVVGAFDVVEKGKDIGEEFFIYPNGEVLRFELIHEKTNSFTTQFVLTTSQIDSLHTIFENSRFKSYPEAFPEPPIKIPTTSTSISYRNTTSGEFKTISAFLSQEPDRYPDGFFELFNYLEFSCY